jgi:hypothetical protein
VSANSDLASGSVAPQLPLPPAAGDQAGDPAGRLLRTLTVLPAVLAAAWLLAGLPLLLLGAFRPLPMLVTAVPIAAVLVWLTLRHVPSWLPGFSGKAGRTPWWSVIALLGVAIAFGADQFAYHSQQIIVRRDPASYIQFGNWLARHGSLPIPDNAAAFGGTHHVLSFYSPAFDPVGHSLAPQFMAGQPMTLAAGFWIGGVGLAVALNALLASCGVLALGGLTARLVGPRWAPLAALTLAVTLPEQFTARSAYSEPLAQVLFLGGLCLVLDSLTTTDRAARWLAALGGLAIGLNLVVRIDGASDMLPLIPYCGLLVARRQRQAVPLIAALIVGVGYGLADGMILTRPYLDSLSGSLVPLAVIAFVLAGATVTGVLVLSARRPSWLASTPAATVPPPTVPPTTVPPPITVPPTSAPGASPARPSAWLARLATAVPVVIMAGLVVRPYVQVVHGNQTGSARLAIAHYQLLDHLPVQPTRLYYELSLHWVFWYLGVPAVALATVGAALLARRSVQGRAPGWAVPLLTFGWIIVATLLRPAITPDQPWASRRLVPGVLPGLILLAVWATAWCADWLRSRGAGSGVRGGLVVLLAAALILPAVRTSFGLAHKPGGPLGVRVVAAGLAVKRTYQGEITAVNHLCAALPADASVVFVSTGTGKELAQVVRGMCGVPSATVQHPDPGALRAVVAGIRAAGRVPVLLAGTPAELSPFGGGPVRRVMDLRSRSDSHTLTTPPLRTEPLKISVWMSLPAG